MQIFGQAHLGVDGEAIEFAAEMGGDGGVANHEQVFVVVVVGGGTPVMGADDDGVIVDQRKFVVKFVAVG